MQSDIEKPALGVFGKSWLKAMSSKKPHLCIPNQRIHKCGFCAKSTLINSENSHSGRAGSDRGAAGHPCQRIVVNIFRFNQRCKRIYKKAVLHC